MTSCDKCGDKGDTQFVSFYIIQKLDLCTSCFKSFHAMARAWVKEPKKTMWERIRGT